MHLSVNAIVLLLLTCRLADSCMCQTVLLLHQHVCRGCCFFCLHARWGLPVQGASPLSSSPGLAAQPDEHTMYKATLCSSGMGAAPRLREPSFLPQCRAANLLHLLCARMTLLFACIVLVPKKALLHSYALRATLPDRKQLLPTN